MINKDFTDEYICTHLGEEHTTGINYAAVVPPIYETSLHVFDKIEDLINYKQEDEKYIYGRVDNPTVVLLEKKVAALEHAEGAVSFASGMAAITTALLYALKPGDHLISVLNAYGPARTFFNNNFVKLGIDVTYVQGTHISDFEYAIRPNTKAFYLESPTSIVMQLQDLSAIANLAKSKNIITMIDNTYSVGIYQKPLDLGIDISIHTITKYIGGHSDIIGGILCAKKEIVEKIRKEGRELYGGIIGPFEAWLAIRGMRTLPIRLKASSKNALEVAKILDNSSKVSRVNYPSLNSFPQYELAQRQTTGSCGLLSFEFKSSVEDSIKFCNALLMFKKGVSWGGFESLVSMPFYKLTDEEALQRDAKRNLVRLYCGIENTQELIDDIIQALVKI